MSSFLQVWVMERSVMYEKGGVERWESDLVDASQWGCSKAHNWQLYAGLP